MTVKVTYNLKLSLGLMYECGWIQEQRKSEQKMDGLYELLLETKGVSGRKKNVVPIPHNVGKGQEEVW